MFLPGVLPSTVHIAVLYLSMMREESGSTSIYFYLSVVWPLLRLTHSLSNLVMSCKVTCLPPWLCGWSESGIPGISLPGGLLSWMNDTVTPPPPNTRTHTDRQTTSFSPDSSDPRGHQHYITIVPPGIVLHTLPAPE